MPKPARRVATIANAGRRPCIYCNEVRPFTNEHVFPAGLGGDDSRYLLKDLVCGYCNTDVFSKLEARFMRSSPAAIGRIFLQKHGRGKGKKASIPTIDTTTTTVLLPERGLVEAEVGASGKTVALLQLLFSNEGHVQLAGGDHAPVASFMNALASVLTEKVSLVSKRTNDNRTIYSVEALEWDGNAYNVAGTDILDKPPAGCVWREPLILLTQNVVEDARKPTLYQRIAGQIVLRVPEGPGAASMLGKARKAVEKLEGVTPDFTPVPNPIVAMSFSMQMNDFGRILAKIGVNLVAHLYGERYVRHHAFKNIKRMILTDSAIVRFKASEIAKAFSGVPHDRHVMTLAYQKASAGRYHLVLFIRLYGSAMAVHLTSKALLPPIKDQFIYVIDYNAG